MTSCQESTAALWADLEGSLPAEFRATLETHLAACPACVAVRNTYRATVDLAAHLSPPGCPDTLEERLRSCIEARIEREKAENAARKAAAAAAEGEPRGRNGRPARARHGSRNDHRERAAASTHGLGSTEGPAATASSSADTGSAEPTDGGPPDEPPATDVPVTDPSAPSPPRPPDGAPPGSTPAPRTTADAPDTAGDASGIEGGDGTDEPAST